MAVSRSKFKVRSGDTVVVIAGKQKGHTGRVVKVLPEKEQVVVEGLRVVKRHQKPVGDRPGGIVEKEMPVSISNVALWNEDEGRRVKVRFETRDGKKVRVDKKSGNVVESA
jgi:large subunit ribosomal protein L24